MLNFPHAKATLNLNWFCGGKDPNRHHYVVRCAPDKIPVQPDKQVFLASVFEMTLCMFNGNCHSFFLHRSMTPTVDSDHRNWMSM